MANSKRKCFGCKRSLDTSEMTYSESAMKYYCSAECGTALAMWMLDKKRKAQARKAAKTAREKKVERKQKLEKLKSMSTVCSEAQGHVNALILAADRSMGHRCIATGREAQHAGHLYHAGTKYRISWLRFLPSNIHGQHSESNTHQSGDTLNYLDGLADRYGQGYINDIKEFKRAEDSGLIPAPTREQVAGMVKWCKAMTKIYKARI